MKEQLEIMPARSRNGDNDRDREVEWGVEGRAGMRWGGNEGPQFYGGISGEVYDNRGNYVEGEANQSSDGKGKAEVRAGHESD